MKTDAYKRTTGENKHPSKKGVVGRKRVRRRKNINKCRLSDILPSVILSASLFWIGIYFGKRMSTDGESKIDIGLESKIDIGVESKIDIGVESNASPAVESSSSHNRFSKDAGRSSRKEAYFKNRMRNRKTTKGREQTDDMRKPHRIGDTSSEYAQLRKIYDKKLPLDDTDRMKKFVQSLRKREYLPIMEDEMTYDIHNCPSDPPADYPLAWNVSDVIDNWVPDDTTPRSHIYQGICVFDFETEHEKAMNYRVAEVPFIVRDDPQVLRTSERWNQPGYMDKLLGDDPHRTEYSANNHFMYWNNGGKKKKKNKHKNAGWTPPTKMLKMPYQKWLSHANITDESKLGPGMEHWYYRLIGYGAWPNRNDDSTSEYLFDELTFFQPRKSLYMTDPKEQKGIHCRFGMKGVIAENHFDATRNMVALMGGERRYILSHPNQCENLALYPRDHPSSRHSAVDWSKPDFEEFPQFLDARVNEVVLQAGDVLYLPTMWFHHIISLDLNFQCNTRSGVSNEYKSHIKECGF